MYTLVPPADLLIAGHFQEKPGFTVHRAQGTQNWLMALTVDGHGEYRVAGETVTTGRGGLVLISPGTTQHYAPTGDDYWGHWWAHFQPRPAWLDWWRRLPEVVPGFFLASFDTPHVLEQAIAAFSRVHRYAILSTVDTARGRVVAAPDELSGAVAGELALNGIEEVLLLAVAEQENQQRKRPDPRVQLVLETIAADPARPVSVEGLARMVSLSPSRLAHLFRREVGDSVVKVAIAMRLRQAARLLEFTERPVGEIAADVGFSSQYYFSRQFRQRYGVPPTVYRAHTRRQT